MATFTQRGDKWRCLIRKPGHKSISRTFPKKVDAEAWAREVESEFDKTGASGYNELRDTPVSNLLKKFRDEVSVHRKGWKWEHNRLNVLLGEPWATLPLSADLPSALRQWRDDRLAGRPGEPAVLPQTVNRDLNLLGSVFTHAVKEWGLTSLRNPAHLVKRPKAKGGERDVTWTDGDLQLFLDHFGFDEDVAPTTATSFVPWVLLVARLTGLRRANVCEILVRPDGDRPLLNLRVPCIHFKAAYTKMANDYDCPLSKAAVALLTKLAKHRAGAPSGKLFEPPVGSLSTLLNRARRKLAAKHPHVVDLRLHDLRHTWTTEMVPKMAAKGVHAMTMAKMAGRRGTKSLDRYYNPKAAELSQLMD